MVHVFHVAMFPNMWCSSSCFHVHVLMKVHVFMYSCFVFLMHGVHDENKWLKTCGVYLQIMFMFEYN